MAICGSALAGDRCGNFVFRVFKSPQAQVFGNAQTDRILELVVREIVLAVQVDVLAGYHGTVLDSVDQLLPALLILLVCNSELISPASLHNGHSFRLTKSRLPMRKAVFSCARTRGLRAKSGPGPILCNFTYLCWVLPNVNDVRKKAGKDQLAYAVVHSMKREQVFPFGRSETDGTKQAAA